MSCLCLLLVAAVATSHTKRGSLFVGLPHIDEQEVVIMKSKKLRDLMSDLEARGVIEYRVSQGRVPAFAIDEINECLANARNTTLPADFDSRWMVQDGALRGKFPKRVAQYIRKYGNEDEALGTAMLSTIGNIARQSTPPEEVTYIDVSSDLDWAASDYGDSGSCFWGCKQSARYALMDIKAFAIRFYDKANAVQVEETRDTMGVNMSNDGGYYRKFKDNMYIAYPSAELKEGLQAMQDEGEEWMCTTPGRLVAQDDNFFLGVGRAWVLLDVPGEDDALAFNLYHMLSGYRLRHAAHILSELLNFGGVRMVRYYNYDTDEGDLHINSAAGALVTSIEKLKVRRRSTVNTYIDCSDYWQCSICRKVQKSNYDNNARHINYNTVCQACFDANCVECKNCGSLIEVGQISKTFAFEKVLDGTFVKVKVKDVCPNCDARTGFLCNGINVHGTDNQGQRMSCDTLMDTDYVSTDGNVISYSIPMRESRVNVCPVCAADSVKHDYCVFCGRLEYEARNDMFAEYVVGGVHVRMCAQCYYGQNTLVAHLGRTVFFADFEGHPDAFGLVETQNHCDKANRQAREVLDVDQRRIEESWTTRGGNSSPQWGTYTDDELLGMREEDNEQEQD